MESIEAEVVVAGSGAGGAAVAGSLARAGWRVLILEAGIPEPGRRTGHVRNADAGEEGLARFGGELDRALVNPGEADTAPALLADYKVVHAPGGMFGYWTCNCPSPHSAELVPGIDASTWGRLLDEARGLLGVSLELGAGSVRQARIIERVAAALGPRARGREVQPMPTAARRTDGSIRFSSFDDLLASPEGNSPRIEAGAVCTRILHRGGRAEGVRFRRRHTGEEVEVRAAATVLACGTAGIPKLLAASALDAGPALGAYLFDHPAIGSRVRLRPELLEGVPADDPLFTVWVPFAPEHPWHLQVCRFPSNPSPIEVAGGPRESADLFLFTAMEVRPENRFRIRPDRPDGHGMPGLEVEYSLTDADLAWMAKGLGEQFRIAAAIGDVLGQRWSPQLFGPGWSTHLMGSCRIGERPDGSSCADPNGRLWCADGLYAAGNAVLSASGAGNPTLMSVALGLHTAEAIIEGAGR